MSEIAKHQLRRTISGKAFTAAVKQLAGADEANAWLLNGVVYQQCKQCEAVFYPAQPLCQHCLSEDIDWVNNDNPGRLISFSDLSVSFNDLYREGCPWRVALVQHTSDAQQANNTINVYAFVDEDITEIDQEVKLFCAPDVIGDAIFIAVRVGDDAQQKAQALAHKLANLTSN